jgi:hypothetical protein
MTKKCHPLNGLVKTKLWHVGLQGYSQSISFTSLLSKNQSPTASAMLYSHTHTHTHTIRLIKMAAQNYQSKTENCNKTTIYRSTDEWMFLSHILLAHRSQQNKRWSHSLAKASHISCRVGQNCYPIVDSWRGWRVPSEGVEGLTMNKARVDIHAPVFFLLKFTHSVMHFFPEACIILY